MKAHIFSRGRCPYCIKAKKLLNERNVEFNEVEVGVDITKEDIQEMVDAMGVDVQIRTVPQIFFVRESRLEYIGGFTELDKYFKEN